MFDIKEDDSVRDLLKSEEAKRYFDACPENLQDAFDYFNGIGECIVHAGYNIAYFERIAEENKIDIDIKVDIDHVIPDEDQYDPLKIYEVLGLLEEKMDKMKFEKTTLYFVLILNGYSLQHVHARFLEKE